MLLIVFLMLGLLGVVEVAEAPHDVPPGAGEPPQPGRHHRRAIRRFLVFDPRQPGAAAHGAGLGPSPSRT
jgi:hypothetical protein